MALLNESRTANCSVNLSASHHEGATDTHLAEVLLADEGIRIGRSSLQCLLRAAGRGAVRTRRPPHPSPAPLPAGRGRRARRAGGSRPPHPSPAPLPAGRGRRARRAGGSRPPHPSPAPLPEPADPDGPGWTPRPGRRQPPRLARRARSCLYPRTEQQTEAAGATDAADSPSPVVKRTALSWSQNTPPSWPPRRPVCGEAAWHQGGEVRHQSAGTGCVPEHGPRRVGGGSRRR